MGTAGGEPRVLLNALKPMLGVVGDIKTPQEVMRVVGMMRDAEKLMSRCVYLNILKATCRQAMQNEEKKETLQKFLVTGGWVILNKWLMEFTKSENFPVLLELIEVLEVLPITVDLLKQGNTGKLMKSMTKLEHPNVKKSASGLIKQWKNMIRVREMKKKPANENEIKGDENPESKMSQEKQKTMDQIANIKGGDQDEKLKRKLSDLHAKQVSDSSGFMNALMTAATSPPIKKKRRNSTETNVKKATLPLDEILKNTSGNASDDKLESDGGDQRIEQADCQEGLEDDEDPSSHFIFRSPAVEAANLALQEDTGNSVVIDEGSLARKKNKKKRNISWAPDESLVQVSYFELMEGEKKGHHAENFSQARQLELMLEKQAMRAVRRGEDRMVEKLEWRRLIPVDNAGVPNFLPGEKSREKFIQTEREKTVLAYIFLTKQSLPDNPAEPDFDREEHNRASQPTMIPHDEERTVLPPLKPTNKVMHQSSNPSATTTVVQPVSLAPAQTVQPKQNQPVNADLVSPAVQNIMTQLLRNNGVPSEQPPAVNSNPASNPIVMQMMGQPPGIPPPSIMPFPPPNNMNPPPMPNAPNTNSNFMQPRPPGPLMESVVGTGIRGPSRGGGPPFPGGRGGFNNNVRGGGEVGFTPPAVPPGPRPRWNGPPNQGTNKRGGNWDHNHGNYDGFHEDNYNEYNDYNDNYNDNGNFAGTGRNENFGNGGRGSRGFHRRGNNRMRGGGSDRGRHNSANNEWGYDGNRNEEPRNSRRDDWNRDDRSHRPDRHGSSKGGNRDRNNSGARHRDDRGGKSTCQHFLSPRGCRNGNQCKFSHLKH